MQPVIRQIAYEYKEMLRDVYGDELEKLILYGSYARGDQHEESDVDFAIVLRNPGTRPAAEIFKTAPLASKLSLKYGLMISSLPVSLQKMQSSVQGIYRVIRNEGIAI
jgi:predicted nucleotidyltransferase